MLPWELAENNCLDFINYKRFYKLQKIYYNNNNNNNNNNFILEITKYI